EEPLLGGYSGVNDKAVGVLAGVRAAAGRAISVEYAEGVRIIERDPSGQHLPLASIRRVDRAQNAKRIAEAVTVAERADAVLLVVGDAPEITRESVAMIAPGDR